MLTLGTAAAALLTGCTSEVEGSASFSGEPRALPDAELQEAFCSDAPVLLQDILTDLGATATDPASAVETLDDVVGRMQELEPPSDVADEWERFITAISDMRDLLATVDPTDPTPDPELAEQVQDLQPELTEAGTAIDEWGQANC
ncbi:hypothetical protein DQ240_15265 [Blastococcus sp. TF02A-26]|nr:hypothetical protein DQ240_15265 [Blastococcus sp. TF02A-26]